MPHFKATVEYDGTNFSGFQWQHNIRTVQGVLETALYERTRQAVRITGAGRTDAGVHALGQVISFECETTIPFPRMAIALNSALPSDVTIRQVEMVDSSFNARFSASSRLYAYLILNRGTPSAIWSRYSALRPGPLDVSAMQAAAQWMLGEQDFACFTNELVEGQTTMRDIMRLQIRRHHSFVLARIEANAFLRGMVRNIMGTLIEVGAGKRQADDIPRLIATRERKQAGPTAPAQGLCLLKARYGVRRDYKSETQGTGNREQGTVQPDTQTLTPNT